VFLVGSGLGINLLWEWLFFEEPDETDDEQEE